METKNTFFLKLKNYIGDNNIPVWKFGIKNSYLVLKFGIIYDDIFTLLTENIFFGDLCLHKSISAVDSEFNLLDLDNDNLEGFKFFNSDLTQKDYYLKYICNDLNYGKFLESALIYYLKFSMKNNELPDFIYLFSRLLIPKTPYRSLLYKDMTKLNIFSVFPLECLTGIFYYFTDLKITWNFVFKNKNDFLLTERNHNIFRFINVFSFHFSPKFRYTCFKDCLKTNSYIPMFLALKSYELKLSFPKLSLNEFKKVKLISDFKKKILNYDIMSSKNIDELIEKNWSYHFYE